MKIHAFKRSFRRFSDNQSCASEIKFLVNLLTECVSRKCLTKQSFEASLPAHINQRFHHKLHQSLLAILRGDNRLTHFSDHGICAFYYCKIACRPTGGGSCYCTIFILVAYSHLNTPREVKIFF